MTPRERKIDGPLCVAVRGEGSPTVVFEAGGGEDSSVWSELEPEVRARCEVRTTVYDRAGLGRSSRSSPPYRIARKADALRLGPRHPARLPSGPAGELPTGRGAP